MLVRRGRSTFAGVPCNEVVVGDDVRFIDDVFTSGPPGASKFVDSRAIEGEVVRERFSRRTAERTVVIRVSGGWGLLLYVQGEEIRRQERTLHLHGCERKHWRDERRRGDAVRLLRERRDEALAEADAVDSRGVPVTAD